MQMKIIADQNIPFVAECFQGLGEVVTVSGREIKPALVSDADALLVRSITPVNAGLLEGSRIRFVGTATIGMDHIDLEYLAQQGIGFASAPGSNANSVAEYVTAALLTLADRGEFTLSERSLGIIGVGNVGSRVEQKARALGMEVRLNDPPLERLTGDKKYKPLDFLYECDILTVHTPLTKEGLDRTWHLVNGQFIDSLKPGAIFINTARGAVMDTESVRHGLASGKITAAVLDVWENEPVIDMDLLQKVDIASPHIAGYSYDGKIAGLIMIYNALCGHFGLTAEKTAADFLPESQVPVIEIGRIDSEQDCLREAVRMIYDIEQDDRDLRKSLNMEPEQRGSYFDSLRKKYRVRREFRNTAVRMSTDNPELKNKLRGIGFHVE